MSIDPKLLIVSNRISLRLNSAITNSFTIITCEERMVLSEHPMSNNQSAWRTNESHELEAKVNLTESTVILHGTSISSLNTNGSSSKQTLSKTAVSAIEKSINESKGKTMDCTHESEIVLSA